MKLEDDWDIDHVVVGPGGLFCISTKSMRGLFEGTPDGLMHNGKPASDANQALAQTMQLKERLAAMMGKDLPWLQVVLALPFGFTKGDACGGKVWLVHQDSISDRLAPEFGPKPVKADQLARLVTALEMLQDSAAKVYKRPDAKAARGAV